MKKFYDPNLDVKVGDGVIFTRRCEDKWEMGERVQGGVSVRFGNPIREKDFSKYFILAINSDTLAVLRTTTPYGDIRCGCHDLRTEEPTLVRNAGGEWVVRVLKGILPSGGYLSTSETVWSEAIRLMPETYHLVGMKSDPPYPKWIHAPSSTQDITPADTARMSLAQSLKDVIDSPSGQVLIHKLAEYFEKIKQLDLN